MELWKLISDLYPEGLADKIASEPVLLLTVSGISIQNIADEFNLKTGEINKTIEKYLYFKGWEENLSFSPWYFYKKSDGSVEKYAHQIRTLTDNNIYGIIDKTFTICELFSDIRKEIEDYYA